MYPPAPASIGCMLYIVSTKYTPKLILLNDKKAGWRKYDAMSQPGPGDLPVTIPGPGTK